MTRPLLSIIIPAFNAGSHIKSIVTKILSQDLKEIEVITVDDGSTDNTLNILRGIQSKDKRLVVLSKKNGGPSSARNLGITRARGTYLMFVDADDDISPAIFTRMISSMSEGGVDLVACGWRIDLVTKSGLVKDYKRVSPHGQLVNSNLKTYALRSIGDNGLLYNLWNKIFKVDIIKEHDLSFREDLKFGEDLTFILKYLSYINSLLVIQDVLYYYKVDRKSSLFGKSSIVPRYRIENLKELAIFTGEDTSQKNQNLTSWIRWRWLLSFSMLVSRSNLSHGQKINSLKRVIKNTKSGKGNIAHTGIVKFFIQRVSQVLSKIPWLLLLLARSVTLVKTLAVKLRLTLRSS